MEDWAIRGRMTRSAMTRHSGDALKTYVLKQPPGEQVSIGVLVTVEASGLRTSCIVHGRELPR